MTSHTFSPAPALGDVNGDGIVSIADVLLLVSHILGQDSDLFIAANSDMNGDKIFSVADVTMIVSLILGTE